LRSFSSVSKAAVSSVTPRASEALGDEALRLLRKLWMSSMVLPVSDFFAAAHRVAQVGKFFGDLLFQPARHGLIPMHGGHAFGKVVSPAA
jgi:hypothetical protein